MLRLAALLGVSFVACVPPLAYGQERKLPELAAEENGQRYDFIFVDQDSVEKHVPKALQELVASFIDYK